MNARPLIIGLALSIAGSQGHAQQPESEPTGAGNAKSQVVQFSPRVSLSEIYTDNIGLTAAKRSDLVTTVSPGFRLQSGGGLARGYVDFDLSTRLYANGSNAGSVTHKLAAAGTLEAIRDRLGVQVSASSGLQTISAAGAQGNSGSTGTNQTNSFAYSFAPYLKGRLGDLAAFQVSLNQTGSSNGSASASNTNGLLSQVSVNGSLPGGRIGWNASLVNRSDSYSGGRTTESDRLLVGGQYAVSPQLSLNAGIGRENSNQSSLDKRSSDTSELGLKWRPTPFVDLGLSRQTRPFGSSHQANLSWRSARTVWQFSDGQDVSSTPAQSSLGSLGNVHDLLSSQLQSLEPDAVKRSQLVDSYLAANGINPQTQVIGNFLTSALSVQRRQNVSVSLLGIRSNVTLLASRTSSNRLDTVSTAVDDLSKASEVQQLGLSLLLSHRLTPNSSVNATVSTQNTSDSSSTADNQLQSVTLGWASKLGPRSSANLGLRRVIQHSRTTPYDESAITGGWIYQF